MYSTVQGAQSAARQPVSGQVEDGYAVHRTAVAQW